MITGIATGDAAARNKSLIKVWCKTEVNTVRNQQELHHVHKLLVCHTVAVKTHDKAMVSSAFFLLMIDIVLVVL